MVTPIASINGLRVEFPTRAGTIAAVSDVSFDIFPGETICIVGESGSGKSVSAYSLMQLTKFNGGSIADGSIKLSTANGNTVDVASAGEHTMRRLRGREIGMIFQEPMTALNPSFSIGWQLKESIRQHCNLTGKESQQLALRLLEQVQIPEPQKRLNQYPHELSGGIRQRVVIAMALACEPRLLIADEPTTALDVTVQAEILSLIRQLRDDTGSAILLITHDMAVVASMADRVIVMRKGGIVETGTVEQIIANPQHEYTQSLLAAVPRLGDMQGRPLPEPMTVLQRSSIMQTTVTPGEKVLLQVKNLVKRFPLTGGLLGKVQSNIHAVEDVSFHINERETLSLVGESGSGKSVTAQCIVQLLKPDSGDVIFQEQNITTMNPQQLKSLRRHMQMVFQDPYSSLNPHMSLLEQVAEPIRNFKIETESAVEDRVADLFDKVHLPRQLLRRFPSELSGGQRQRVAIARALAPDPRFIVADEALSALDVSIQAEIMNLLLQIQAEYGISMLFISHDMAVVERMSHRVAVMYLGRIVELGTRQEIFENAQHEYTRLLMTAVPTLAIEKSKTAATGNLAAFATLIGKHMHPDTKSSAPVNSPIHPVGYQPQNTYYEKITESHYVLKH